MVVYSRFFLFVMYEYEHIINILCMAGELHYILICVRAYILIYVGPSKWLDFIKVAINPHSAKLFYLNFHPLEVTAENYSYLFS